MTKTNFYVAPCLDVTYVTIETGFANSPWYQGENNNDQIGFGYDQDSTWE